MDLSRVYIVVPAYNEASAVCDVVRELRGEFRLVVVVDDGSRDATASEAARGGAIVLRHVLNRGQGAALQTGIEFCLIRGADIIVTFDADGQHRIQDVHRMLAALESTGADLAIGSRFLDLQSNLPASRRLTQMARATPHGSMP